MLHKTCILLQLLFILSLVQSPLYVNAAPKNDEDLPVYVRYEIPYELVKTRVATISGYVSDGNERTKTVNLLGTGFIAFFKDKPFFFTTATLIARIEQPEFRLLDGTTPDLDFNNIWVSPTSDIVMIPVNQDSIQYPEISRLDSDNLVKEKDFKLDVRHVGEFTISTDVGPIEEAVFTDSHDSNKRVTFYYSMNRSTVKPSEGLIDSMGGTAFRIKWPRYETTAGGPVFSSLTGNIVGIANEAYEDVILKKIYKDLKGEYFYYYDSTYFTDGRYASRIDTITNWSPTRADVIKQQNDYVNKMSRKLVAYKDAALISRDTRNIVEFPKISHRMSATRKEIEYAHSKEESLSAVEAMLYNLAADCREDARNLPQNASCGYIVAQLETQRNLLNNLAIELENAAGQTNMKQQYMAWLKNNFK